MSAFNVSSIGGAQFPEVARWIHSEMPQSEFCALLESVYPKIVADSRTPRLEVSADGERMAAVYFLRLPGRVGALGGVRASPKLQDIGVQLLKQCVRELRNQACSQIQAVVPLEDRATQAALQAAGFTQLTVVRHMWLDLHNNGGSSSPCKLEADPRWLPASDVARRRLARLVAETFKGTLDCPAINGLRSDDEVLDGFLDGTCLRSTTNWELLEVDGALAGCLLLEQHSPTFIELTYMGVTPEFRGRGLGDMILRRAVQRSIELGANLLIVAVDEDNWPAMRLYQRLGFEEHRGLAVWLEANT